MNKSGLNVTSLSLITIGVFMIYCGFTDRSPVEVLKAVMSGDYKNLPASGSWSHPFATGGGKFKPLPGSDKTAPKDTPPPNVMV